MIYRKIAFLFILACLLFSIPAFAASKSTQYWPVGKNVLNFGDLRADGQPKRLSDTIGFTPRAESVAFTSDAGELLFLGNGADILYKGVGVADRMGHIASVSGKMQGAVILPYPGKTDTFVQIYLTVEDKLSYVVITPEASSKISDPYGISTVNRMKALTVVETAEKDGYWIICLAAEGSNSFEVYKFTVAGFTKSTASVPVLDTTKILGDFSNMKASTDGKRIALVYKKGGNAHVGMHAFDVNSGGIGVESSIDLGPRLNSLGGCEFSPDGRFLYAAQANSTGGIYQIDLATKAVQKIDAYDFAIGGLQLAMNGRIYAMISSTATGLGCISNPNKAYTGDATGCVWSVEDIMIANSPRQGLPVFVQTDLYGCAVDIEPVSGSEKVKATREGGSSFSEWGVTWSTSALPTSAVNKRVAANSATVFEADLAGEFGAADKLYVWAYIVNGGVTTHSSSIIVTKIAPVFPSMTTVQMTGTDKVKSTRTGGDAPTEWGVCWGTDNTPTTADHKKIADNSSTTVEALLTADFDSVGTLYARAYAVIKGQTRYGAACTVTKTGPKKPVVISTKAKPARTSVNFTGSYTATDYTIIERGYSMGKNSDPTLDDMVFKSEKASSSAESSVVKNMFIVEAVKLISGATYHYRPYVKADDGTVFYGVDGTVTTVTDYIEYSGKIVDKDGAPIAGARINTPYYLQNGRPLCTITDASGVFSPALRIPASIKRVQLVATADGKAPRSFTTDDLKNGKNIVMSDAVLSGDVVIQPQSGTLPDVLYVTVTYGDGGKEVRQALCPTGDGKVRVKVNGALNPFTVFVDAAGFEGNTIASTALPGTVTMVPSATTVDTLKVGDTPTINKDGSVKFTVSATAGGSVSSSSYIVNAYVPEGFAQYSVTAVDDGAVFSVTCDSVGSARPSQKGVLLKITDTTPAKNVVLVYTWLAPEDLDGKITGKAHVIKPVDPVKGGEVIAKGGSGDKLDRVQAYLPPEGLDTTGLPCGSPTAYIEIRVHELGQSANVDVLQRSSGTFQSLAEVNLNLFCGDPIQSNSSLKELVITIPFDPTKVSVEALESGAYRIYHSANLGDFETSTNLQLVPVSDIILIDPVAATITFKVSHLSVFGVGSSSSIGGSSGGGCTMAGKSDWTLPGLVLLAMALFILRARRKA